MYLPCRFKGTHASLLETSNTRIKYIHQGVGCKYSDKLFFSGPTFEQALVLFQNVPSPFPHTYGLKPDGMWTSVFFSVFLGPLVPLV